ncbi:hypothetical protein PMPD1_1747 [Paramixta manurensis]|uniref:LamG domain-containing protein n=1 Tax=Paramixta manurensis TaxID=2740817 RepID=A0A6M8UDW6_9GAMM|nr:hypothetical protein PMPD1_1747 [Erwiniaceae bacterium PD-1]
MRILLDADFSNPDLPLVDPFFALNTPDLVAGYAMLDHKDFSGNGNDFSWNGTFSAQGAVLTNDTDHIMTLPFADTQNMTVVFCWSLAAGTTNINTHIYGNLRPANDPRNGIAHRATGTNVTCVAGGNPTSSLTATSLGAWTLQAHRYSASKIERVSRSLNVVTANVSSRVQGTAPFYVNGSPTESDVQYKSGTAGTIGMLLFYDTFLDNETLTSRFATIADIMQSRGVLLP